LSLVAARISGGRRDHHRGWRLARHHGLAAADCDGRDPRGDRSRGVV